MTDPDQQQTQRCGADTGHGPCPKPPGAGTDHPGVGPCLAHNPTPPHPRVVWGYVQQAKGRLDEIGDAYELAHGQAGIDRHRPERVGKGSGRADPTGGTVLEQQAWLDRWAARIVDVLRHGFVCDRCDRVSGRCGPCKLAESEERWSVWWLYRRMRDEGYVGRRGEAACVNCGEREASSRPSRAGRCDRCWKHEARYGTAWPEGLGS